MNSLLKNLGVLAVSSIMTLGSYGYAFAGDEKQKGYQSFNDFGKIQLYEGGGRAVTTVTTADVDGDGDQDIIVGIEKHNPSIYIIENKMPQKNKENKEPLEKVE